MRHSELKRSKNLGNRDGKLGPLQRALNDYLAATGNLQRGTSTLCIELWPQVVGPWYARKTQILGIDNGEARVLCDAPSTAQQLQMDQAEIISRLNERLGGKFVKSIRASSAGRAAGRISAQLKRPMQVVIEDAELQQVVLSEQEVAFCEAVTSEIADEKLRQSFLNVLTNDLKRRCLKQQRGYRNCTICGGLHNEIGPYCIACATAVGSGAAQRRKE